MDEAAIRSSHKPDDIRRIYLCLPDASKSYVAGTFKVRLPKQKVTANLLLFSPADYADERGLIQKIIPARVLGRSLLVINSMPPT